MAKGSPGGAGDFFKGDRTSNLKPQAVIDVLDRNAWITIWFASVGVDSRCCCTTPSQTQRGPGSRLVELTAKILFDFKTISLRENFVSYYC